MELEEITEPCEVCQLSAREQGCMRDAFPPEHLVFNRVLFMDLMTLESHRVPHNNDC